MAEIVAFRPGIAVPAPDPYRELQRRRTDMISAWTAWLATEPSDHAVALEIDGTLGALRSLAALARPQRQGELSL